MPSIDPAVWRDMLNYLRVNHADICRQWFEELEPLALQGGLLQIRATSGIHQNYLSKRCNDAFTQAAQFATGNLVGVSFVNGKPRGGNNGHARARAAAKSPESALVGAGSRSGVFTVAPRATSDASRITDGYEEIVLSPDYSFDNFVTGPGNRLAYAASCAVGQQPGKAYNPLFIHGGVGLGKTHLLQAICQTVLEDNPDAHITYLSCDSFMNQFYEAIEANETGGFRHRYRHVDMLVIDDIHFLADRERTQEEFFHTFNTLYQAGKQIVLSSDSPPNEIPQLEERLVSRFNWGLVARVDRPCYETRIGILRKKAQLRGLEIPDDVVCYIASRIESNTRELEGAITKVQSLSMLHETGIDLELAQKALGDEPGPTGAPQITIQTIIDAVTDFFGVKLTDLQSKRRHRSITVPRQVCMYLARERTNYSLEEIGGYFGGRDHTTVMHACKTTKDRMEMENDFARQIETLDQQITKV